MLKREPLGSPFAPKKNVTLRLPQKDIFVMQVCSSYVGQARLGRRALETCAQGHLRFNPLIPEANGVYKLHLRTSCCDDMLGSSNSGWTIIPFTVAN